MEFGLIAWIEERKKEEESRGRKGQALVKGVALAGISFV